MAKRTRPDANQSAIEEAINLCPGCRFIDTHDVPRNLPELVGFPDGLVAIEGALTILCEDPRQVLGLLVDVSGLVVIEGLLVPVEIKAPGGELRASQRRWGELYGVPSLVLRTVEQVSKAFRGGYGS